MLYNYTNTHRSILESTLHASLRNQRPHGCIWPLLNVKNVCKLWWKAEKYLSYTQAVQTCNTWNLSLFVEVDLIAGWRNIFFSFLSLFDSEHEDKMKDSIIIPKSQIQKLWKLLYSHQMVYNLCFYILTWENDTHNVWAVVNKVRPCSLFGLKTAGLPCFHFYLFFSGCMKNSFF